MSAADWEVTKIFSIDDTTFIEVRWRRVDAPYEKRMVNIPIQEADLAASNAAIEAIITTRVKEEAARVDAELARRANIDRIMRMKWCANIDRILQMKEK